MNRINAKITGITSDGNLSLIELEAEGIVFSSVILDTPESSPFIQQGNKVTILFKETEVIVATSLPETISLRNRIPGTLENLEKGRLLSRIIADTPVGQVRALITTHAADELDLKPGASIFVMVKTNELMLSE
jgi:molybdopterin-binding protein